MEIQNKKLKFHEVLKFVVKIFIPNCAVFRTLCDGLGHSHPLTEMILRRDQEPDNWKMAEKGFSLLWHLETLLGAKPLENFLKGLDPIFGQKFRKVQMENLINIEILAKKTKFLSKIVLLLQGVYISGVTLFWARWDGR